MRHDVSRVKYITLGVSVEVCDFVSVTLSSVLKPLKALKWNTKNFDALKFERYLKWLVTL